MLDEFIEALEDKILSMEMVHGLWFHDKGGLTITVDLRDGTEVRIDFESTKALEVGSATTDTATHATENGENEANNEKNRADGVENADPENVPENQENDTENNHVNS